MIELVFVIVILGILAAVAIPRLVTTRDDAEIVKAAQNVTTSLSDLMAYYTSQGTYSSDFKVMTNVTNPIVIKGDVCATYSYVNEKQMLLTKSHDGFCRNLWEFGSLKTIEGVYSSDAIIIVE